MGYLGVFVNFVDLEAFGAAAGDDLLVRALTLVGDFIGEVAVAAVVVVFVFPTTALSFK
jgi:hypothetical protein